MRARNREVNIFNMSILDILCGALGAFCFMMLALFPYYKPSHLSAEDKQSYQNVQQMQQKLQQLETEMEQGVKANPELMRQVQNALGQARQQLAQTQQQLDRTRANMEQAQKQAQQAEQQAQQAQKQAEKAHQLEQQAGHKIDLLDMNVIYAAVAQSGPSPLVEIDIQCNNQEGKIPASTAEEPQTSDSSCGDVYRDGSPLSPVSYQMALAFSTKKKNYVQTLRIYYRLIHPQDVVNPVAVYSGYNIPGSLNSKSTIPVIKLSASHPSAIALSLQVDQYGSVTYQPGGD